MIIGVPREIKRAERRVGLLPSSVRELTARGHDVLVEREAGAGIGARDLDFENAGAKIVEGADELFDSAELIVKVKEPQAQEWARLRPQHTLFTYLHLAPDPRQTQGLLESGATCIAYETVTDRGRGLPLLAPMSQVAGRLAVQAGAHHLTAPHGGSGVLIGGVPGVAPAEVVVVGGGVVGSNAIEVALGMGASVTVLDRDLDVLEALAHRFGPALATRYSTAAALDEAVSAADLVIGAVLVRGDRAPKLITRSHLADMRRGSVIVDVAIDQGGSVETARPTTHDDPTYVVDGIVHYCVANMPGAVPVTATSALNNATLRFVVDLADKGTHQALADDPHLRNGLNVHRGHLTEAAVARAQGLDHLSPEDALRSR